MVIEQFHEVAATVAQRTAELLQARVWLTDPHGAEISCSVPAALSEPLSPHGPGSGALRVPICLAGQTAEVSIEIPARGEAISPRLANEIVQLVVNQATVAERLADRHDLKDRFIRDLLRGTAGEDAEVRREAQIFGMDVSRTRAVIVVDAAEFIFAESGRRNGGTGLVESNAQAGRHALRARLIISSIVSFFHLPNDAICGYIGDGEVAVLKAITSNDLAGWTSSDAYSDVIDPSWANLAALKRATTDLLARLRRDTESTVNISIGRYHPGIRGIPRSFEDARAALELGRRFHGENQIHCLDDLSIPAFVFVSDPRTKANLARHLLSPLDDEPELLQTLDAFFFENCSASATAARLSIHRNTLAYRLDKIASLAGLDPRHFDDAVKIRLALLLRSLSSQHDPLCGRTISPN